MRIDIKNAFDKHNIEIKSLAEKIGVSRQSIHYFINQGDKNSFDNIKKISEVSGIPEEDFFVEVRYVVCPHCGKELNIEIK